MKRSYLIAALLVLAIGAWMAGGQITTMKGGNPVAAPQPTPLPSDRASVAVVSQTARVVARQIVAQGQVEPNRIVTVRAETAGRIDRVVAEEGQPVGTGDVLARVAMGDRQARLGKAEAIVTEREAAYAAAQQLGERGYQTQRRVDEALSALRTAEADLAEIRLDIAYTTIRAPFDGILETRLVEVGDYVAVNGEVAAIVDNDPIVAVVQIAQQDVGDVGYGDVVGVEFATGQTGEGIIRYIAPRAESATRTFRVEIEVPNPDSQIRSGTSAEARIPTGSVSAHFVSPALLSLDDVGQVGVKTVDDTGHVAFHAVTVVRAEAAGVWVSGLPDVARIITVGQGFVQDGEAVTAMPADDDRAARQITGTDAGPTP